ncbi:hypothetical protein [Streptomyces sp. NPDC053755]|uniref:hypothetical protein n=1 Tax=Streptomyces sp. NPDC053755 TaxID=3155815 RepID=UPI0034356493
MKKYLLTAAVAAAAFVTAAPTAVGAPAAHPADARPAASAAPAAAGTPAVSPSPIEVVRPGERIDAGKGWTVWLTRQGKHWAGEDGAENFRSVVDGNIDLSAPGVSHQSEGDADGVFHSGIFYGTHRAGRVELTEADGTKTVAALLSLPGRPGWGVWYAHTPPAEGGSAVALYDREGRLLADLPAWDR